MSFGNKNKIDYSKFSDKKLKELFSGIIDFPIEPFHHQYLTLAQTIGENQNRVMYGHGIGSGKTLTALLTSQIWEVKKLLVVCPYSAFPAWKKNITKYTSYSYVFLTGSSDERKYKLKTKKDIYIINYEGLKTIYANLIPTVGWEIDDSLFVDKFDCTVFDEVHRCMEGTSLQSKICFQVSHRANYAIGLTGSLTESDLLDLWGEYRVVDLGNSLGTNYYAFRNRYFKEGDCGWYIKRKMEEKILRRIAPITTVYDREEYLPDKEYETRIADATAEQKKLEKDILKGLNIKYKEGTLNLKNVLNLSQKLLQVSGGFLYLKGGIKYIHPNPKLKVVDDVISETYRKVIIFHQFVEEGRILENWCEKKGIKYSSLRGEIKDKPGEYDRFINKPDIKVMIAHPISGGESLDDFPEVCSVVLFYSNSGIFRQRKQAEGRIWREGQVSKCVFIDINLKNSVDDVVCKRYKSKKKLSEKLLNYIRHAGVEQ